VPSVKDLYYDDFYPSTSQNMANQHMDAIGTFEKHAWEKQENPQTYELMPSFGEHARPSQHVLGIVGGNEVPYKDRMTQVDIESDLRGTTRANTFCPTRQHKPTNLAAVTIHRDTPKEKVLIPVYQVPLKQSQMWAYPATLAADPLAIETCVRPEKY
jgi:hypothetical protein